MLKNTIYIHIFLFISFVLSSCVTSVRTNYLQEPSKRIPSYPHYNQTENYRVVIGDELNIAVFSLEQEANQIFNPRGMSATALSSSEKNIFTYTVLSDSCIDFPYVGKVHVLGKTLREISVLIKESLKNKFIVNDFSVVTNLVNNSYSIITEGGSSNYKIVKEHMTIFQAIATAKDLPTFADRARIKIIRQTLDGVVIKEFDIRSKDLVHSEFYYIQPNDVIYIQSFDGQFFRLESFTSVYSLVASTISVSLFLWALLF